MYKYLDQLDGPEALKTMTIDELTVLAYEIRKFLVQSVSETGGHLSSNLGVVELTIALHYCFDSPKDHFVWDVSHQSYVHKLLTGRKDGFKSLRQFQGMSGFTKRSESVHDKFDTGHSSTSISAALGIAAARDLKKEAFDVVSIIGDGALTGGMAFEALNHLGHTKCNVKVILNDNAMSISKNVGGLSKALNRIRTHASYSDIKGKTKSKLTRIPGLGKPLVKWISKTKDSIKVFLVNHGMFFEDMGITYIGPVDGHDLKALIEHLNIIKQSNEPVLLHVVTEKGKGYAFAEKDPDKYHGVGPFNPNEPIPNKVKKDYSNAVGETLVELAKTHESIVAISAAMIDGTGLSQFEAAFPERIYDVGICEQHAVTFAAGLATQGIKPFVTIYSTFLQRAYDQILHDVCIQKLPLVFCIDRAGLVGNDGETHHGIFDIAYLNSMPNMKILSPMDVHELKHMLAYAATYDEGPLAIRYPRGNTVDLQMPVVKDYAPRLLLEGEGIALVATGNMVQLALQAGERAAALGVKLTLVSVSQVKPLHTQVLRELLQGYKTVITIEDHTVVGGLGDVVAKAIGRPVKQLGIQDNFVPQGDINDLMSSLGMDAEGILNAVKEVLNA